MEFNSRGDKDSEFLKAQSLSWSISLVCDLSCNFTERFVSDSSRIVGYSGSLPNMLFSKINNSLFVS
jgi:hypothetical protein